MKTFKEFLQVLEEQGNIRRSPTYGQMNLGYRENPFVSVAKNIARQAGLIKTPQQVPGTVRNIATQGPSKPAPAAKPKFQIGTPPASLVNTATAPRGPGRFVRGPVDAAVQVLGSMAVEPASKAIVKAGLRLAGKEKQAMQVQPSLYGKQGPDLTTDMALRLKQQSKPASTQPAKPAPSSGQMSPIFQNPASKYKYGQEARTAAAAEFFKKGIKPEPKLPSLVRNTEAPIEPLVKPGVKPAAPVAKPVVRPVTQKPVVSTTTPASKPQLGPTGKPLVGGIERRTPTSDEMRFAQAQRGALADVEKVNTAAATSPTPSMKPERESLMKQAADLKATRERIAREGIKTQTK